MPSFDPRVLGDSDPGRLIDALFSSGNAAQRPIFDLILAYVASLPQTRTEPQAGHVLFSRHRPFAALKPGVNGVILALAGAEGPGLSALRAPVAGLKKGVVLPGGGAFDAGIKALVKSAWAAA